MRYLALSTLLSLAALAPREAGASEPPPAHSCDGNTCKIEMPPLPDPASGVEVEDPFAPPPSPAGQAATPSPSSTLDLDPAHVPPPPASPGSRHPVLEWGAIIGAGIASVVAGALVVRRLDAQARSRGQPELEDQAASLRLGLAAAHPGR